MEFRYFGWNAPAVSFWGINFMTILGAWALYDQKSIIVAKASGKSAAIPWFLYYVFMLVSFVVYGISELDFPFLFHGLVRGALHFLILLELKKFRSFRKRDVWLGRALLLALIAMIFAPFKEFFFLAFAFGGVASVATQVSEIRREKSSGVVSIRLLAVYTLSSFFWVFYGWEFEKHDILATGVAYLAVFLVTIGFWLKFREKGERYAVAPH